MSFSVYEHPEMDEITFEHRHKAYGAYQLRRMYNERLLSAFFITIGLVLGLLLVFVLTAPDASSAESIKKKSTVSDFSDVIVLPKALTNILSFTSKPKTKKSTQGPPREVENAPPVVVDEIKEEDEVEKVDAAAADTGEETVPDENMLDDAPDQVGKVGYIMGTEDANTPIYVPEKMPEFPGGQQKLIKFLQRNLSYPERERSNGTEGTVIVSFVVNKKGKIEQIKFLQSIGAAFEQEIIRVIDKMPRWTPGQNKAGKKVSAHFVLPFSFKLNGQ